MWLAQGKEKGLQMGLRWIHLVCGDTDKDLGTDEL